MKIRPDEIPTSLIESYIFANVPEYLYDQFRVHPFIISLSITNSLGVLIESYNNMEISDFSEIEFIVLSYAILISISLSKEFDVLTTWNKLNLSRLKWGEKITQLVERNYRPVSYSYQNYVTRNIEKPIITSLSSEKSMGEINVISVKTSE